MERLVYIVSAFNKKVNEHCRLLGPPYFSPPSTICTVHIMNVYKKSKSLVNTRKEEEEKGEKKVHGFLFFLSRVIMDFVCTRAA